MVETDAVEALDTTAMRLDAGPFRPPEVGYECERVREILITASQVTDGVVAPSTLSTFDSAAAGQALNAAENAVLDQLVNIERSGKAAEELRVLLAQFGHARAFLRDAELARRSSALSSVQHALHRLRAASSIETLIQRLPREITELGFARATVSRIQNGFWFVRECTVQYDNELAREIVRAGSEYPAELTPDLFETEMTRRRRSICIDNPQTSPRMNQNLKEITGTKNYVAAPIVSGHGVIGFLHADEPADSSRVDHFSRDMLGMFAEGIGYAVERVVFYQRLQALRDRVDECTRDVANLVEEISSSDMHPTADRAASTESTHLLQKIHLGTAPQRAPRQFALLSRRELEVLRLMATGATNAQIAAELVVGEGTVKTHVKNILRKLGAANRAEAAARYEAFRQSLSLEQ